MGGVELGYSEQDVIDPRWIIQLGVAPVRIDLMSEIAGFTDFESAWKHHVDGRFGTVPARYIGLDELIRAKQAAGRAQDRADVRILRRARGGTPPRRRTGRRSRG